MVDRNASSFQRSNPEESGVKFEDKAHATISRAAARLPPLGLFRTFSAAARHSTFKLAADELCVTPSAVSQQIRQLEEFLDTRLFRRLTRKVELTKEGIELSATVHEVLAMLATACDNMRDPSTPVVVCLNAQTSLAVRWLVSKLKNFSDINKDIRVSLLASTDPLDFERQDVDIGIRWGIDDFPGMRSERLEDIIFPVCNPELAERVASPADLANVPLLQLQQGIPWTTWFKASNWQGAFPTRNIVYFNDTSLMLEAAVFGQGVVLASALLAENDIRGGRLQRLFDTDVVLEESFHVLSSEALGNKPAVAKVRDWLQAEARKTTSAFISDIRRD